MGFEIQIEDGSKAIPKFVIDENTKAVQLYDWQRRAINYFFSYNKAIFEVTTGAGKTWCAIVIVKKIWETEPDAQVLIVVPKNIILEDTWYKELYLAGVSLRDIGVYYGRVKEYSRVTITNMQNLNRIELSIFDVVIFDEIHNYGTERLLPYLRKHFKYKLGLSATMERMDNAHYEIMKIFDYNVFNYTPQEALKDGVLNPFNFINISVVMDRDTYEEYDIMTQDINNMLRVGGGYNRIMRLGGGLKNKLLGKMNKRKDLVNNYYRKFDVVKQIVNKHRKDKIIVFNEYNAQTSKSYWYLLDIGVKACVMHSGIDNKKRQQNLIDFKTDKYNVILASKVLDEGWNLPAVDTAIIAAGNSTSRQTIQRMGRVLRKKKKISMLYQIYCADTIEERYAFDRAKLFKQLCSNYNELEYDEKELVL